MNIYAELEERIALNAKRLSEPLYQMDAVFSPPDYRSYGDKEGRAMLAFLNHYRMTGKLNPCLAAMLAALPERTNAKGYFGPIQEGVIDEFQFGPSTWYLRALCEAAEIFEAPEYLDWAKRVFEGLYLPASGLFADYPTEYLGLTGDILGSELRRGKWILCSDIGSAFLALDGLAVYYAATRDDRAKALFDEMLETFNTIDLMKIRAQTHASLTAARGMVKMYNATAEAKYIDSAKKVWDLYTERGMTLTYENFNWFGREDSWTEPCAIVDSLILALEFYRIYGKPEDLTLARRIWHNGMAYGQRPNGGAGVDTCVTQAAPILKAGDIYEAWFCCTMRIAEGLMWAKDNAALLDVPEGEAPVKDKWGRLMAGDILCDTEGRPLYKLYRFKGEAEVKRAAQRVAD